MPSITQTQCAPAPIGETFGRLTVLADAGFRLGRNRRFRQVLCRCECGTERPYDLAALRKGHTASCGCVARNKQVMPGDVFGRLTVLERHPARGGYTRALCQCECGNRTTPLANNLRRGVTTSCGCNVEIHHHASHVDGRTPTYISWKSMRQRCNDENYSDYAYYGGRGIAICGRWDDYRLFLEDMGERPAGTSLDRIAPDGNYEPSNCRWADKFTQRNNRRDSR